MQSFLNLVRLTILFLLLFAGQSCIYLAPVPKAPPGAGRFPQKPVYVLAGHGDDFEDNSLSIFDATDWRLYRRVPILRSAVESFARDPKGRIWIGFAGEMKVSDNRVQIFSSGGDLITTLFTCKVPKAGIQFAVNRAFVVCSEFGPAGQIDIYDLETLRKVNSIHLDRYGELLDPSTSAANEQVVVVSAAPYLFLIDPKTMEIEEQIGPFDGLFRTILPYGEQFYLLNKASTHSAGMPSDDIFVLTPGQPSQITSLTVARSPLWGVIQDNALYSFHDPTYGDTTMTSWRVLTKTDLRTQTSQVINLPEMRIRDLAVIDQNIIVPLWFPQSENQQDGLYQVDLESGELTLLAKSPRAEQILAINE